MAPFEILAVVYFAALAAAATFANVSRLRRAAVAAAALVVAASIVGVARGADETLRAWAPHVYLVLGYWLPALLTHDLTASTPFEQWLVRSDLRLRPLLPAVPPPLVHLTELAYLVCYPLVPAAFGVVWSLGGPRDIDRFWVAVLGAGYACYASLPWLLSRPPRLLDRLAAAPRHVGAVNVFVLGRVSHQLNTFPSGHVAVAAAAAVVVATIAPVFGVLIGLTAVAIAVGAAAGRYHYVIDVLLGFAAAAVALAAAWEGS